MDYIKEACLTKSDQFHGELIGIDYLKALLRQCTLNLNALDKVKKALFYGKAPDVVMAPIGTERNCANIHLVFDADKSKAIDIIHSIVGKATESCEQLELMLKTIEGEKFDPVNFREEIGDGQWYDAIGLNAVGGTFEQVQTSNIEKLRARYPNKFTEYDATHRDLVAERGILESGSKSA